MNQNVPDHSALGLSTSINLLFMCLCFNWHIFYLTLLPDVFCLGSKGE